MTDRSLCATVRPSHFPKVKFALIPPVQGEANTSNVDVVFQKDQKEVTRSQYSFSSRREQLNLHTPGPVAICSTSENLTSKLSWSEKSSDNIDTPGWSVQDRSAPKPY